MKTVLFEVSLGGNRFLSVSGIRMGLIKPTGRSVAVLTAQIPLVVTGYRSRLPDRCPRLIPDHYKHRRMLAHRHQTGIIRTGFIWYLLTSSGSAHGTVMAVPKCFVVLMKGVWIVASKKQDDQSGRGWPWTHQQYRTRPALMFPILVMVYQFA